jgi:hypothetical protein
MPGRQPNSDVWVRKYAIGPIRHGADSRYVNPMVACGLWIQSDRLATSNEKFDEKTTNK